MLRDFLHSFDGNRHLRLSIGCDIQPDSLYAGQKWRGQSGLAMDWIWHNLDTYYRPCHYGNQHRHHEQRPVYAGPELWTESGLALFRIRHKLGCNYRPQYHGV